ncbi:uncharacterized protein LOC127792256 isoform X2 [Diospyros lotus]|uniref:uncharacterized protein LOC127792256 isoform X2 n=1 Tax=Diospyros lotus TaxID=55363 RepID=UPI00225886A3|nr:uncharacterized protein LOC127792256 isoform X2 [Diospyros lotus]
MANILGRFKRFSAALDEEARARLCKSSGSEHSAAPSATGEEGSAELSELVELFLERGCGVEDECCCEGGGRSAAVRRAADSVDSDQAEKILRSLVGGCQGDAAVRRRIQAELEAAQRRWGACSPEGFKRRAISWLRQKGLCKSRWPKTRESPAGEHEYIDMLAGARYIIEISLATQFTIARPTDPYSSLLQLFPEIIICREDELKMVARLMCAAMRKSLKQRGMHVPPWRRNAYVQAKWFGPYRRTTNVTNPMDRAPAARRGEV